MLTELLDQADEWHLDTGGKHWKLYVNGQFACVLPYGSKQTTDTRPVKNARRQIKQILSLTA
jgi:hypothetical protein